MTPFEICMLLRAIMRGELAVIYQDHRVTRAVEQQLQKWALTWAGAMALQQSGMVISDDELHRIQRWSNAWTHVLNQIF